MNQENKKSLRDKKVSRESRLNANSRLELLRVDLPPFLRFALPHLLGLLNTNIEFSSTLLGRLNQLLHHLLAIDDIDAMSIGVVDTTT